VVELDVVLEEGEVVVVVAEVVVVVSAAPASGGVEVRLTRNTVNVRVNTATAIAEYVIRRRITASTF
jgi:hypothetical protein